MLDIADVQKLCNYKSIAITQHARQRLVERGISIKDVQDAILSGEIIKQYEDDTPVPSCLILGKTEQDIDVHVVASVDDKYLFIITAYLPSEDEWETDLKTRKGDKQ